MLSLKRREQSKLSCPLKDRVSEACHFDIKVQKKLKSKSFCLFVFVSTKQFWKSR